MRWGGACVCARVVLWRVRVRGERVVVNMSFDRGYTGIAHRMSRGCRDSNAAFTEAARHRCNVMHTNKHSNANAANGGWGASSLAAVDIIQRNPCLWDPHTEPRASSILLCFRQPIEKFFAGPCYYWDEVAQNNFNVNKFHVTNETLRGKTSLPLRPLCTVVAIVLAKDRSEK